MAWLPALAAVLLASSARAQAVRPVEIPPASLAWGLALAHVLESPAGRAATLAPALAELRTLDLAKAGPRASAGPLVLALQARQLTPGSFLALPEPRRFAELARAAESIPEVRERYIAERGRAALESAAATAEALGAPKPEPPYLRMRRAADGREAARLAREFASGLRRTGDREYVTALWETASAPPSSAAHRVAARALIAELGWLRGRDDARKILALKAMKALADRTPYAGVERRLVSAALDEAGTSLRDPVAREAEFLAQSVAVLSPYRRTRRLAAKGFREAAGSAGDERERELRAIAERLEAPPQAGWWPSWKGERPRSLWDGLVALVRSRLVK